MGKSDEDQEDKESAKCNERKGKDGSDRKRKIYKKRVRIGPRKIHLRMCGSDPFVLFSHGKGLRVVAENASVG